MNLVKGFLGASLLAFAACSGGGEPSESDMVDAYKNVAQRGYDEAVRQAGGSTDNLPPMVLGLLKFEYDVSKTECEASEGDLGFDCIYDLTVTAANGETLPTVKDVRGRFFKGSDGWMVEERLQ